MKQKLELTWYGKENVLKLEPRILIEDTKLSYSKPASSLLDDGIEDNMLIHGDNLLALKALEKKYSNLVKCIYIDPPYNTGSAFDNYDDNLEHSIWLSLMSERLKLLRKLLSNDGALFISIDDDERDYLKILCDEIFGRHNFVGALIWEKKKKPSFLSNIGVITEYVLIYAKNKSALGPLVYGKTTEGKKYPFNNAGNGEKVLTFPAGYVTFNMEDQIVPAQDMSEGNIKTKLLNDLIIENGTNKNEFQLLGEWRYSQEKLDEIISKKERIVISKIPFRPNHIKAGGEPKKMKNLLSVAHYGMATNEDATNESRKLFGTDNAFDYPKPEKLIQAIIESITVEGDLVLDSFLGSGTTISVAHKLKRKWIGIEMGDQVYKHCKVRIDKVINGEDLGGITKDSGWKDGGGYRFYELAPTLINEDVFGEPIICKDYSPEMLASAVALHEGFSYLPDDKVFWKQSKSNENAYLFVTTATVTVSMVKEIESQMADDEFLVIACKSFEKAANSVSNKIKIKKIPQMLLGKCEFGKDNYDLNIIHPPVYEDEEE